MIDNDSLQSLVQSFPPDLQLQTKLSVSIANKIMSLIQQRGMTRKSFADALGRRPSEISKWLSGEHNFTIATLARISSFFGEPIITVASSSSAVGKESVGTIETD